MTLVSLSWLFLVVAFALANLPWLSERILFVFACKEAGKPFWARLGEWLLLYCCTGLLAAGLEHKATGDVYPKGWEFYSIGFFIFLVFAFPGFLYRHGYRRRARGSPAASSAVRKP